MRAGTGIQWSGSGSGFESESIAIPPPSRQPAAPTTTTPISWVDVKLYIDEIGALRGRGRNVRAEKLAAAAGLAGLSIHGDAFVGRSKTRGKNLNFGISDLSPTSKWCADARVAHSAAAAAAGHGDTEHLASGEDDEGRFDWSQTDDEVEVRVKSLAPEGKGVSKRVKVSYPGGDTILVKVDGEELLRVGPLFARIDPGGCAWTLDGRDLCLSLEKGEARAWAKLTLSGNA